MCGCNGGVQPNGQPEPQFKVTLPNGSTKVVSGEHAAKIEITIAGGGTYSRL